MKKIVFLVFLVFSIFCYKNNFLNLKAEFKEPLIIEDIDYELDTICVLLQRKMTFSRKVYCVDDFQDVKADRIYEDETHSDIIKYFLDKEKGRPNYLKKLDLNKFYRSIIISYNKDLSREQLIEYAQTIHKRDDVYAVSLSQIGEWANTISNDTFYNYNSSIFDDYCIPHAWDITTSKHSVKVGVIDTGIDGNHEDLCNQINNNLHHDFSDDYYLSNSPLVAVSPHGTNVAGIIGASGNNNYGICGICWDIDLVSLKIANNSIPTASKMAQAINYARIHEIPIVNISATILSQYLDLYLATAINNYTGLIVCSVGNYNINLDYQTPNHYWPAYCSVTYNNVISVGAIDQYNIKITTSNFGQNAVSLFAFGNGFYTTSVSNSYSYFFETSCAAPFVTGTAALMLSINPNLTGESLKSLLISNSDKFELYHFTNNNSLEHLYQGKKLNSFLAVKASFDLVVKDRFIMYNAYESLIDQKNLNNFSPNYNYSTIYELDVLYESEYEIYVNSLQSVVVKLYDDNFNELYMINISDLHHFRSIYHFQEGDYYLKIQFQNYNANSLVTTMISHRQLTEVYFNQENVFSVNDVHLIDLFYTHNQEDGFYYINFDGLHSSYNCIEMPDRAMVIYNDIGRTNIVNKTNTMNHIDACSYNGSNQIVAYLKYGKTYYFDLEFNIGDLYYYKIKISSISAVNIDNTFINNSNYQLIYNQLANCDIMKAINVISSQAIDFDIEYIANGNSDIKMVIIDEQSPNNTFLVYDVINSNNLYSYTLNLPVGKYYIGIIDDYGTGSISIYLN